MNTNVTFFSIVIPTYNRAQLVGKTIETILKQEYQNFEIIVVDDGSKDNTEEVISGLTDSRLQYFRKQNGERGAARNFGAAIAKGTYINFFDSDDLMYSNHLATAAKLIEDQNSPEIFHLGYDFKTPAGTVTKKVDQLTDEIRQKALYDNILSCNGVFVRKDIADAYRFEENRVLASAEDWELWIRLISRYKLIYSNEITTSVVTHDQRSLRGIATNKIIDRDLFLIDNLKKDSVVMKVYGKRFNHFIAERYTFFMLCLAEDKRKREVISWAFKAFSVNPATLLSKRFLSSLKQLVLS